MPKAETRFHRGEEVLFIVKKNHAGKVEVVDTTKPNCNKVEFRMIPLFQGEPASKVTDKDIAREIGEEGLNTKGNPQKPNENQPKPQKEAPRDPFDF